mmetsp:Transcript_40149/g.84327  ORF Transcript_40149/g.84327 Transcript_40149/m.84327 type:complete len:265 (+) Transcript_40149:101-895(+)
MDEENNASESEEHSRSQSASSPGEEEHEAEAGGAPPLKRNINSYYGHKIGFLQTLSLTLNAGLMVYAHVGLSAVILSSQDPSLTSSAEAAETNDASNLMLSNSNETKCNAQDLELWIKNGGEASRPSQSNYCSRDMECYLNTGCIETCFEEHWGYSSECSTCFGVIPTCSVVTGCMMVCADDSLGSECNECNTPCIEDLKTCMGFPNVETVPSPIDNTTTILPPPNEAIKIGCNAFDLQAIDKWYNVYDLTFAKSVRDAWNGDA